MASQRLKNLAVGVVATLIIAAGGPGLSSAQTPPFFPTQAQPLLIDAPHRRILVYAEVNPKGADKTAPHFGVVFQGGKLSDKALLQAFCSPQDFHSALDQIGAKPGNTLTLRSSGEFLQGDELALTVILHDQSRGLAQNELIEDSTGRGFRFRFGGNHQKSAEEKTGCITCLESCPVGITSNAA